MSDLTDLSVLNVDMEIALNIMLFFFLSLMYFLFIDLVPFKVVFMLYLYGDYKDYKQPVICLYCLCCLGVNYIVVICKALSISGVGISLSAVNLQCRYIMKQ